MATFKDFAPFGASDLNAIDQAINLNVSTIDEHNVACVILQYAKRYGIPLCRKVIDNVVDILDVEESASKKNK